MMIIMRGQKQDYDKNNASIATGTRAAGERKHKQNFLRLLFSTTTKPKNK